MGQFSFTIPSFERPVSEVLLRIPRPFRDQAIKGFAVLVDVPAKHYGEILDAVVVTLESRKPPFDALEKSLGISKSELGSMFAAAMLVVPMVGEGSDGEEFLAGAVKAELVDAALVARLRTFVSTVSAQRSVIAKAMKRSLIPSRVFPYFSDIDIAVDLRTDFEGDEISEVVPVALIHIDTDARDSEIWFQCSKGQLASLKEEIDLAVKKMEAAEVWSSKKAKLEEK